MKTKNLYKLTLSVAAIVLLSFNSCNKFLDQKPITDVSTDVVFSDVPSAGAVKETRARVKRVNDLQW